MQALLSVVRSAYRPLSHPLRHMLDHAREAVTLSQGKGRAGLDYDRLLELALVRLPEVIGEAASRVSGDERVKYAEVPWFQIVSLRNRLIHRYDAVDLDILQQIIESDLPPLIATLTASIQ